MPYFTDQTRISRVQAWINCTENGQFEPNRQYHDVSVAEPQGSRSVQGWESDAGPAEPEQDEQQEQEQEQEQENLLQLREQQHQQHHHQQQPPPPTQKRSTLGQTWTRQRQVILMVAAQFFGVTMNLCVRLLEHDSDAPIHPVQILFVRMVVTIVVANAYMYWNKTPHAPLGQPEMRRLLLARGIAGFMGIYGMWHSIMYLPLAEATVITFLVPSVTGYLCHVLIQEPFTRREQAASLVALAGVVLIARPASLLGLDGGEEDQGGPEGATPAQRLGAIAAALVGVVGTSGAFLTIRRMGPRVHPLVSMNYFSLLCMAACGLALVAGPALGVGQPGLRLGLPPPPGAGGAWPWALLLIISVCGFLTQFLMTASLGGGGDRSNRATAMVYTGMLFAAAFDRWVFGVEMGLSSVSGCALIIGSAVWAALAKKESRSQPKGSEDVEQQAATATTTAAAVAVAGQYRDVDDVEREGE